MIVLATSIQEECQNQDEQVFHKYGQSIYELASWFAICRHYKCESECYLALKKYTSLVNGRGSEKYIIIAKLLNNEKGNVIAYKILDFYGNIRVISKKELQIYVNENLIVNASIVVKKWYKIC